MKKQFTTHLKIINISVENCRDIPHILFNPARFKKLLTVMILGICLLSSSFVFSQNNWTGAVSTDWNTAGNWSAGTVPTASTLATIPATATNPTILNGTNALAEKVIIQANAQLNIETSADLTIANTSTGGGMGNAGTLNNMGTISINNTPNVGIYNTSVINNDGIINISNTGASGIVNYSNNSALTNAGTINISNTGATGIGNSTVNFTNTASGIIMINDVGGHGMSNSRRITNFGMISIEGVTTAGRDGLRNEGGNTEFINHGTLTIGANSTIARSGIGNRFNGTFINETGGLITIDDTAIFGAIDNVAGGDFTNRGTINMGLNRRIRGPRAIRNTVGSAAVFLNDTGGIITIDNTVLDGISVNDGTTFTNRGTITLGETIPIGRHGLFVLNNSNFNNEACAKVYVYDNFRNQSATFNNDGFLFLETTQNHITGTFNNNGTVNTVGSSLNGIVNNQIAVSETAVNTCATSISSALDLGVAPTFTVSGVYTDAAATTSAGTYDAATNTFTPTATLVSGTDYTYFVEIAEVGCSSTSEWLVKFNDTTNPTAICQDVTVQLDANGDASTTAAAIDNGSSDACGIASLSLSQAAFLCAEVGGNTVTLTVTDNNGNSSTCDATVTVEDNIAPVAICPSAPTIQLGSDGVGFILNNGLTNGTSTDNCSVSQSSPIAIFDCEDVGIPQIVVLTATDGSGNIGTADCTVNVIDVTAPAIPTYEVTLELDETGNVSITAAELGAGSTDACGVGTMEITGGSFDPDAATFGCNSVGETTVELTVTDINGNSRVRDISVTVIDMTPAEIECRQPVSTTVTPGVCGVVDLTVLPPFVLSDNCGIGSGISISRTPAGNDFPVGTTVLTWTVTDSNGNDATCESLVIVQDTEAPTVNSCNTVLDFLDPNSCSAQVTVDIDVTDNCGIESIEGAGSFSLPFGIHDEVITITDVNGNVTTHDITIYVHDDQAPELVMCPEDIEITANQGQNAVALPEPSFTDNCSIDALTNDAPEMFTEGTTTVTWTAEDTYGNTADCSYDVTVTPSILFTGTASPIEASTETESSMVTWNRPEAITHCEACLITDIPEFIFLGEFEGHQYFLYPNATNWTDATVLSEEINAQLVTINDVRENEFIQNQLPQTGAEVQYWTGLSYQNYDFAWLTDAAFDYVNFGFDPVLNFDVINAAAINADGTWAMQTANMENGFLAERPCLDVRQIAPIIETENELGETVETLLTSDADWAAGEYTVIYEATDMCDSTATFSFGVTVQEPTAIYCQTSGLDQDVWLDRVVFNDYLNESENNAGYADYTEETVELLGDNPVSIQLIPGGIDLASNETPLYWRIFADWNNDGDFFDTDEILHEQTSVNVVNLDLPALLNEEDLTVRLRVAVAKGNYSEACADYTTGEAEDYALFFPAIEMLGEEEGSENNISIYPNPASNNVTIDLTNFTETVISVDITNNLGKVQHQQTIQALKQKNLRINLQDLNNGIYFVNMRTAKGEVFTERLVVAKAYNWTAKK